MPSMILNLGNGWIPKFRTPMMLSTFCFKRIKHCQTNLMVTFRTFRACGYFKAVSWIYLSYLQLLTIISFCLRFGGFGNWFSSDESTVPPVKVNTPPVVKQEVVPYTGKHCCFSWIFVSNNPCMVPFLYPYTSVSECDILPIKVSTLSSPNLAPRSAVAPLLSGEIPLDSDTAKHPEKPWKEIRVLVPHDNVETSKI